MVLRIGVALGRLSQHIFGMCLRLLACLVVAGFLLTGCVHSFDVRERHTAKASRVYTAGNSFAGNGQTLLLFSDGRWESWGSSCTETRMSGRGTYTMSGKQITFFRKAGKPETLEEFRSGSQEYLGTREEQWIIRKNPKGAQEYIALKRRK
jgi:hypothetical protein